jgi:hypothetical protein
MGWSLGYDSNWGRDIGYGVPAYCDHPDCHEVIDRGLAHVCGSEPYGGERGCGLYFCPQHLGMTLHRRMPGHLCERCYPRIKKPFSAKPDHPTWMAFKLIDDSWADWRKENPEEVSRLKAEFLEAV